jgi:uncharacterized membrane protein YjjP (DUF1212 family)
MMSDLWKLPRQERATIITRVTTAKLKIDVAQITINQLVNQLSSAQFDLNETQKELTSLQKKYNIPA